MAMTKEEAREKWKAAKKAYRNRAITFDEYVEIKKDFKKILLGAKDA